MQYTASLSFSGNTEKAFGLAEFALTAIGFRLTQRTAESLEMVGPGMNSTRESALVGASRIHILSNPSALAIEADLGGVERMSRFVTLFPLGLALLLAILFAILFGTLFNTGPWLFTIVAVTGINAVVWLLVGPWMARRIRARTCRGLDALLANMVAVGQAT